MDTSWLGLNGNKTEIIMVGKTTSADILARWPPSLALPPNPVERVRNLRVVLDSEFSFIPQIRQCAKNASYDLHLLYKVKHLLSTDHRKDLIQALIISRLDVSNGIYPGLPFKWMRKLQLVQYQAARLVFGLGRRDNITTALHSVHWLPVLCRIDFKVLCLL